MTSFNRNHSRRKQHDASHQKNWLTGRHAVAEMLSAGIWSFTRLCATEENRSVLPPLPAGGTTSETIETVSPDRLTELCGTRHHQGLAAQMGPFPYRAIDELPSLLHEVEQPLVVICDRIQDAFNLGAILRCCDAMAVTAVVIGESDQVGITAQVARSSAGAVNYVPIIRVGELSSAAEALSGQGFHLLAASEKSSVPLWDVNRSQGTALVIGSEAHGVSSDLLELCDQHAAIPMMGQVDSLNAAVAAGILLYELRRPNVG